MTKVKGIYIYHVSFLFFALIVAVFYIRYLLFNNPLLIVEHRDVFFPPHKNLILQHYSYGWSSLGSHPNYEGITRCWYAFLLMLSPTVSIFSRVSFIFHYFVMLFIPYISIFYLFKNFLNFDQKTAFLSSISFAFLYSSNPYVIQAYSPPYTYVLSYSLLPALIACTILLLSRDNFASKLLLAFVTTMAVTPIVRYVLHVFIIVALTTLFYSLTCARKSFSFLAQVAKKFAAVASMLFFLNFYWLLPVIFSFRSRTFQPSYVLSYDTTLIYSKAYKIFDVVTLKASWWPFLPLKPLFWDVVWSLLLITIPILTTISLLRWKSYKKEEKSLLMIGITLFVIGIFLWKGLDNAIFFSKIYEALVFSTPPTIGWMFRVPGYFGSLAVLGATLCIGTMVGNVLDHNDIPSFSSKSSTKKRKYAKYTGVGLVLFLILTSTIISWQRATGDLDGILRKGYYQRDRAYLDELYFKRATIILDEYEGNFKPHHTGKPYVTLPNDLTEYFLNRIKENDVETVTYLMRILGSDALITNTDLQKLSYSQKTLNDDITIYLLDPSLMEIVHVPESMLLESNPRYDHIGSLSKLTNSCQVLPLSSIEQQILLGNLFLHLNSKDFVATSESAYAISLFDATIYHNPSRAWSKAGTNDPLHGFWHLYLEKRGLENWDSDCGKGLIFTWAASRLKDKPTPNNGDLMDQWTFDSTADFDQWKNYTAENQFGALYSIKLDDGALKAELWNSTGGWKRINSPLVPAEYSNWYRWELQIKGENAHIAHIKIIECNAEEKMIDDHYIKNVGSGNFDWNTITVDYTPESPETKYVQLQIWHGKETEQPLPNVIWIDNVKIYNLQRFVEPVTLEIPFATREKGDYVFLARCFQNQQGGKIRIQLDNRKYTTITQDQLNKFEWKEIDTIPLEKGQHKITLTNLQGFNAVNLFALIPEQEYYNAQDQLEQILQNKRIIKILEAETDLYHQNTTTSNKYGGEASNGQILLLNQSSTIWQNITMAKTDNYRFAIRAKGRLQIQIDTQTYTANSPSLNWNYLNATYLNKGNHRIQITTPTNAELDVIWLYSTRNPNETLLDIFSAKQKPAEIVNYKRINPTKYTMNIKATQPFIVSFAEAYDPLWIAHVNGERIQSIPLCSVINGFWINQTGQLEITIEYEPQKWFYYGSIISITTLLTCLTYLTYNWTKNKAIWKRIKTTLKRHRAQ